MQQMPLDLHLKNKTLKQKICSDRCLRKYNVKYRNPPRIIHTFISQNQTLKYRCGLYADTIFRNFLLSEMLFFFVDLQVQHR